MDVKAPQNQLRALCFCEQCGDAPILKLRKESKALRYAVTCLRFNKCLRVGAGQARQVIYLQGCQAPSRVQDVPLLSPDTLDLKGSGLLGKGSHSLP